MGRKKFAEEQTKQQLMRQRQFFDTMATAIQKIFRGYISRKYVMDFYERKAYINTIKQNSDKFISELRKEEERQMLEKEAMKEAKDAQKFDTLVSSLHHLLSTGTHHGIFSSPFGDEHNATAFGIPIENHIRQSFHSQYMVKQTEMFLEQEHKNIEIKNRLKKSQQTQTIKSSKSNKSKRIQKIK